MQIGILWYYLATLTFVILMVPMDTKEEEKIFDSTDYFFIPQPIFFIPPSPPEKKTEFYFNFNGATIRIGREIQCLLYAGFFV